MKTVLVILAGACVAVTAAAEDKAGRDKARKLTGQVVSVDETARTITLRSVSAKDAQATKGAADVQRATGSGTTGAVHAGHTGETDGTGATSDTVTLMVSGKAVEELDDYSAGQWVEVTCAAMAASTAGAEMDTARSEPAGTGTDTGPGAVSGMPAAETPATDHPTIDSPTTGTTTADTMSPGTMTTGDNAWGCRSVTDIDGVRAATR